MIVLKPFTLKGICTLQTWTVPPSQGYSQKKDECELYLKQPWTPPQRKINAGYYASKRKLAIKIGRWSIILVSKYTRLRHVCSYNGLKNKANFLLECPLYKAVRDQPLPHGSDGTTPPYIIIRFENIVMYFYSH